MIRVIQNSDIFITFIWLGKINRRQVLCLEPPESCGSRKAFIMSHAAAPRTVPCQTVVTLMKGHKHLGRFSTFADHERSDWIKQHQVFPSCQYVISWRRFVKEVILVRQSPILPTSLTVWINQIPQDYLRGIICAGIMGIRRNWANKYAAWDHGTDAGRQRRHLAHNQYVLLR